MTISVLKENKMIQIDELESKKDLIKRLYCKGSTDDELNLFMHACKRTGLDPFMRQIYAIKRGPSMTIQTGIDGFRLIAERTGNYSPGREPSFTYDEKGNLTSATAYIKKMTSDKTWHEVAATAYMEEYKVDQGLWKKMPRTMLAKCAESIALRKAFPAELSGIYTKDEMDQADSKEIQPIETEPFLNFISPEKQKIINDLWVQVKDATHEKKVLDHLGSANIASILDEDFDKVVRSINRKLLDEEMETVNQEVCDESNTA